MVDRPSRPAGAAHTDPLAPARYVAAMDRVEDRSDDLADAGAAGALELRPPRHAVDPRAVRWWTAQALLTVVPAAVALVVGAALSEGPRSWLLVVLALVVVGGGAYVVVMPRWRYRVHRWETTDEAVYAAAGWIWQEWRVAPLSRVQTVDTVRGPLQQLFGLATVTVTTASAKGALKVEGLDAEVAADLVEQLTAVTQATPDDAT